MKKLPFIIALSLICSIPAKACDVCNIFEYKPYNTNNYIGLFYHYRKFNGYNDLGHSNSFFGHQKMHELDGSNLLFEKRKADYEQYHTLALRMNYVIWKKYNLLIVLPYENSSIYYHKVWSFTEPVSDTTIQSRGLGDVLLSLDRNFIFKNEKRSHLFRPGLAIELPTGNHSIKNAEGILLDPDLQAGSGSFDLIMRLNYLNTAISSGWGYSAALNYKIAGPGAQNYQFGNSWNSQIHLLYVLTDEVKELSLIPKLGIFAEGAEMNRQNSERISYTGGESVFANLGFDIQFQKWSFQTLFQLPVYQNRNANQIGNAGRLNLSLLKSL